MTLNLEGKKRVVIKIGSALLVENGQVKEFWLDNLTKDVLALQNLGLEVILVSSGSISLGKKDLDIKNLHLTLSEKQAASSIGQIELMSFYKKYFVQRNIKIAQILLTNNESSDRKRYLNAKNTLETLLKNKIVPIINENDAIATEEIIIGDNDRLAARVSQMVGADVLFLLSDVDGLYDRNPKINKNANFIEKVDKITAEIEKMASGSVSDYGTGGMVTKINAAKMAFNSGCDTIIANGLKNNPLKKLLEGEKYTIFKSDGNKLNAKKQWIADSLNKKGAVVIDNGAKEALNNANSLLPVGVKDIIGDFEKGDAILIKDLTGRDIACGISFYSSLRAKDVIGKNSNQIKELSYNNEKEFIHKDNLVIL